MGWGRGRGEKRIISRDIDGVVGWARWTTVGGGLNALLRRKIPSPRPEFSACLPSTGGARGSLLITS